MNGRARGAVPFSVLQGANDHRHVATVGVEGRGRRALVFRHRFPTRSRTLIRAEAMASPRGFGSVKVEATIEEVTWRTSVFPLNRGGLCLAGKGRGPAPARALPPATPSPCLLKLL